MIGLSNSKFVNGAVSANRVYLFQRGQQHELSGVPEGPGKVYAAGNDVVSYFSLSTSSRVDWATLCGLDTAGYLKIYPNAGQPSPNPMISVRPCSPVPYDTAETLTLDAYGQTPFTFDPVGVSRVHIGFAPWYRDGYFPESMADEFRGYVIVYKYTSNVNEPSAKPLASTTVATEEVRVGMDSVDIMLPADSKCTIYEGYFLDFQGINETADLNLIVPYYISEIYLE